MKPVVQMEPTTFRIVSPPLLGSRTDAAVPLVAPKPTYQRIVILQNTAITGGALVSAEPQELNTITSPLGLGQSFRLIPLVPMVMVLAPHQGLYTVATVVPLPPLAPTRISVSASVEVPGLSEEFHDYNPSTLFRTLTVPSGEAIEIVPGGGIPKRVVIEATVPPLPAPLSSVFVSDTAEELNIPSLAPGASFEITRAVGARSIRVVFITAPAEPLYAIARSSLGGPVAGALVSVSISNLHLPSLRGPTGIPGPDGEE